MPTISDVAAKAGVSPATVSRVINGGASVAKPTRARVLAAIDELGYTPNLSARALSLGKSTSIGVLVPLVGGAPVTERLHGLASRFSASGYEVNLFDISSPQAGHELLAQFAGNDRVAAVVTISLRPSQDQLAALAANGVPVVVVDARAPGTDCVFIDDAEGGRMAARHLLSLGHRRLAFVGGVEDEAVGFLETRERRTAYQGVLATAGVDVPGEYLQLVPHGTEQAYMAAGRLLDLADPPTAIFATSDTQAVGVISAANERGLTVPEDVSVMGFDDIAMAAGMGLTTIRQPLQQSGSHGAKLALEALEHKTLGIELELPLELVRRRSTAQPKPQGV